MTNTDVIITYDVDSRHTEVKAALKKAGFQDSVIGDSGTTYLPNTTLWKANTTPKAAVDYLRGTCDALKVKLEQAIAAPFHDWYAIFGSPHQK